MGGQYRKVGARIAVSSLLVTSLGLSVLAMAPAANAVEIPMCENIGQPGIIGTATETGARFTWDDVGDYVHIGRRNTAAAMTGRHTIISRWETLTSTLRHGTKTA